MSWDNELKEEIKFRSPNENVFYALWRKNERSFEKKLGMFDPPKFKGTIVQDLDVRSTYYPLTVYFDGMYHHKDADEFYEALTGEVGQWAVIHPVKGFLSLQLISYREIMNPMEDGNYTTIETEWIAPANVTRMMSLAELAEAILTAVLAMIQDMFTMLAQLRTDLYSAVISAANTLNTVAGLMDSIISEIAATSALVQDAYNTARASFDNALASFGIDNPDTEPVGAALVDMAIAPVAASSDFSQRFTSYNNLSTELVTLTPETTTIDDYNTVISQEFGMATSLVAVARIVASSEFSSRSDVVSAMENITSILNNSVNAMESAQDNFSTLGIDLQYFSQTKTYTSLVKVFSLSMQFLISQFYNLKAEKRFTLKTSRSPIEITVTEYGGMGENDFYYNLFLKSNQLSGKDILLLPAGREVIIHVG